jgi:hypothetical protein
MTFDQHLRNVLELRQSMDDFTYPKATKKQLDERKKKDDKSKKH